LTSSIEWWSIGVAIMAVLIGLGLFVLCLRAAGLLGRLGKTLDEIDKQIPLLSEPIATTLAHVGGIADTADTTLARLGVAVGQLETVAATATKTASGIGAIVTNYAANLRRPKVPAGTPATPTIVGAVSEPT
jgi:uncharacterized protein YoxC